MIDKKQLWSLAEETMRAFGPFYQGPMQSAIQDSGATLDNWFGLSLARGSAPVPFTVARFHALFPYTAREQFAQALEALVQLELLEKVGQDVYRLTGPGRRAVESIYEAAHQGLGTIELLPAHEMAQLNALLYRLVEAILDAPEPQEKWAIAYSRWTDPGEGASGSVLTDQYLTDLLRFRDDAHLAAWKPCHVSGYAWEALTLIWHGQASTAEELAEQLPYRSHTVEDYREALQDLAARRWVVEEPGGYQLTEEGKQVREEAEETTDRTFYAGWSALSEEELARLQDLLTQANENLQAAVLERLWGLTTDVSRATLPVTRDVVNPLIEKHGLDKPGFLAILLAARGFEPEPVSLARLSIRGAYTNPAQYQNLLNEVAEAGFAALKTDGEYKLTEKGRAALHQVEDAFYMRLGEMDVLPEEDLTRLEGFLQRLASASLAAEEPTSKWCITTTHRGHPSQEYAPLARVDQHLDDLNAFRDDAHLAAWQPHDVSGHAWETFTFVWRGEAGTAEELVAKLPYRGYPAQVYAEALEDLADRGWVEKTAEGYRVTGKGGALRQEAEDATDHYFFAPWACLDVNERNQLHGLLARLKKGLHQLAESNAEAA